MARNSNRGGGSGHGRGRGGGRGRGRGGSGHAGRSRAPRSAERQGHEQINRTNQMFEGYYNELEVVDEGERPKFWRAAQSDLPNSFRFAGSRGHALTVQRRLIDHYIPQITSVMYDGEQVAPPTPVQWYPDRLAWSMTTPKNVIRKFPPFASFQKFLVSENNVGNITRQEVVSMIPPLLLDVEPGMTVLDLCAAPGSKSAQLIEMVHGGEEARVRKVLERVAIEQSGRISPGGAGMGLEEDQSASEGDWSDDGRSTGLLIANDVDYKRAQMLIHQCKRLNSPNIIVTNHDAILFPSIKIRSKSGNAYLKFDRVLADVPCSGDGTCRKNLNVWNDWSPATALGLHITQVRILVRALSMLKVGGRVVYSTCSMNPVENEAVVASAIDRCGGSVKVMIVDKSGSLPGLSRKPGLKSWKIMGKTGRIWSSWEEVSQAKEAGGEEGTSKLIPGMFAPASETDVQLDRCIRVYPHLQDTGGFFITVLEKLSEIKARPEDAQHKAQPARLQPQASSSIMTIVDEIKHQSNTESNGLEKIDALDHLLPNTMDPANDMDEANTPAAARQNRENAPNGAVSPRKRSLNEEADASSATKRLKTREEVDEPAVEGAEGRQVHWPPPPGAALELTAHQPTNPPVFMSAPLATITPNNFQAKKNSNAPHEEPFKYISPDQPELLDIYAFYHLSPRFPRDRFMVRNATGQPVKSIYYTSSLAREILTENEGKGIKFVHCGVKMFVKQDTQGSVDACKWRIQSEGLPIVEAWVGEERVVRLWKRETLRKLLIEMFPKVGQDGWMALGEIGERVRDLSMGCCVLRVEPMTPENEGDGAEDDGFQERLVMPLWRGISSLNLMLPKEERKAMLLRLFNDDSPLIDHSKDRFKKEKDEDEVRLGETVSPGNAESAAEEAPVSDDPDTEGGVSLVGHEFEQAEDTMMGEAQNQKRQDA